MKRKKLYILITLLTAVIIFSTAAMCNQCSLTSSTTTEKARVENTAETVTTVDQTITETTANEAETIAVPTSTEQAIYANAQYGFNFSLPKSWEGYSIITSA